MNAPLVRHDDPQARLAVVAPSAVVSRLAVVGAPGEWVARATRFPAVIGPQVVVREFARIHAGCVRNTMVGAGSTIMSGSYVGHDVQLGRQVEVGPNAVLGGLVTVGHRSRIMAGAEVLPRRRIGRDCVVAAGAVVTHDMPDGQTWSGDPAVSAEDVRG